jgi:SAM-dependent methyltransferase
MATMSSGDWDERYAAAGLLWGARPNQFLVQEVAGLTPGRALDVATGEGRNAIWLAQGGWRVTGIDFSAVALDKARAAAEQVGVAVEWIEADVLDHVPEPGRFDLVTILYLHLAPAERRRVLARMSAAVAEGGTLLIVGHDLDNLTRGYGGPQDPDRLWVAEEAVEELPGLIIEKAGQVVRTVELESGPVDAIDTLIRARRG